MAKVEIEARNGRLFFRKWELPFRGFRSKYHRTINSSGTENILELCQASCPEITYYSGYTLVYVPGEENNEQYLRNYCLYINSADIKDIISFLCDTIAEEWELQPEDIEVREDFCCDLCGESHITTWSIINGSVVCAVCASEHTTCPDCGEFYRNSYSHCPHCYKDCTCYYCESYHELNKRKEVGNLVLYLCKECYNRTITIGVKQRYDYKPNKFVYHYMKVKVKK